MLVPSPDAREIFKKNSKVLIQISHKFLVSRTASYSIFSTEGKVYCDLLVHVKCMIPIHFDLSVNFPLVDNWQGRKNNPTGQERRPRAGPGLGMSTAVAGKKRPLGFKRGGSIL